MTMMKLELATFRLKCNDGEWVVCYSGDSVRVLPPNATATTDFENLKKDFKPCITHSARLIERVRDSVAYKQMIPRDVKHVPKAPRITKEKPKLKIVR